jgi:hypothetical protein
LAGRGGSCIFDEFVVGVELDSWHTIFGAGESGFLRIEDKSAGAIEADVSADTPVPHGQAILPGPVSPDASGQ